MRGDARTRASRAVMLAVRAGALAPVTSLPCRDCGGVATAYHHHLGYEPQHQLAVVPLCDGCHSRRHVAARPVTRRPVAKPLTLRLPPELHAALVALAERHDRSLHGELVAALRAYAAGAAPQRAARLPVSASSSG